MTTFLLIAILALGALLAAMTFLTAAVKDVPLSPVDNLPDTTNVQQWTDAQVKYFRLNAGLQRLYADLLAADPGDEQSELRPEDAYSKKLRLNAEHEAELAARKAHKSAYHKAWYQEHKEARKAQIKAPAQAKRATVKRDAANERRRAAQLLYWTPERKAAQSLLTEQRMAAAKRARGLIIAPAALLPAQEKLTPTYGQRALA